MNQTVRAESVDEKKGAICIVSMFPFWLIWSLNYQKKVHFLQFCVDLSVKCKSVKEI